MNHNTLTGVKLLMTKNPDVCIHLTLISSLVGLKCTNGRGPTNINAVMNNALPIMEKRRACFCFVMAGFSLPK